MTGSYKVSVIIDEKSTSGDSSELETSFAREGAANNRDSSGFDPLYCFDGNKFVLTKRPVGAKNCMEGCEKYESKQPNHGIVSTDKREFMRLHKKNN